MYLQAKPTKLATGANNAARTVTNTKKFDHVTPVLREFQWSSVKSQLEVRDVTLLYKVCHYGLAPASEKVGCT